MSGSSQIGLPSSKPNLQSTESKVRDYFLQKKISLSSSQKRFLIMFSGGVDSSVLLELMLRYCGAKRIRVLHIKYGFRGEESCREAKGIQDLCLKKKLVLDQINFPKKVGGDKVLGNLQGKAREFRYDQAKVIALREGCDYILTAHHCDDHLETLFSKILKGKSPSSLSEERLSSIEGVAILRPLSHLSKLEIMTYAKKHNIPFFTDSSNAEDKYERNYLRNRVFPLLDDRFPNWRNNLVRTADYIKVGNDLLEKAISDEPLPTSPIVGKIPSFPLLKQAGIGSTLPGFRILSGFDALSRDEKKYILHAELLKYFPEKRFSRKELEEILKKIQNGGDKELFIYHPGGGELFEKVMFSRAWVAPHLQFSEENIPADVLIEIDVMVGDKKIFTHSFGFFVREKYLSGKILFHPFSDAVKSKKVIISLSEKNFTKKKISRAGNEKWEFLPISGYKKSMKVGGVTLKKQIESGKFPVQVRSILLGLACNGELLGFVDLWGKGRTWYGFV